MKKNNKLFLVLFLGTLSSFGPFIMDLYIPSLPTMAEYFNVNTSLIQLTLTGSILGIGLGQLFIGPISDKYGRKKPIIISLIMYIVSTLLIIFSSSVYGVIFFRFLQGFSAAGSLVISRAVAADLYSGKKLTEFFGMLMAVNGIAPIISPIGGSILLEFVDWRGIFVILTLIGVVLVFVANFFQESLKEENRKTTSLVATYTDLFKILKKKQFMSVVLIQTFAMGSLFGYISSSTFIIQVGFGLSALMYSLIFALNGLGIVLGTRIAIRHESKISLKNGVTIMFFAGSLLLLALALNFGIILVEVGFFMLMAGFGMIAPSVSSIAMSKERANAGSASAILGFVPMICGALVSPIVGIGNIFYATGISLFVTSSLALIVYLKIKKEL